MSIDETTLLCGGGSCGVDAEFAADEVVEEDSDDSGRHGRMMLLVVLGGGRRGDMEGLWRRDVGCMQAVGVDGGMVTKICEGVVDAGLTVGEDVVHCEVGVGCWGGALR